MSIGRLTDQQLEDFWSRVAIGDPDECWFFTGPLDRNGYGKVSGSLAHRVASHLTVGPIPRGICVLHCCDIRYAKGDITYRRCCNPSDLWRGTQAQNVADMIAKGRNTPVVGDRNGSRLHPERLPHGDRHYLRQDPARTPDILREWHRTHPEESRGESNGRAKLTGGEVLTIFRRVWAGETNAALGDEYGVSPVAISHIKLGKAWGHLGLQTSA